jgi:phosphonate transport system permease protein
MNRTAFVWSPWAVIGAFTAAVAASFAYLGTDLVGLLTGESARQMSAFAAGFFPPDLSPEFLARAAHGAVETLAISAVGTLIAALIGVVLALPGAGRWGRVPKPFARLVLTCLRAIPELVWAAFMVLAAGLGPFAGSLALAL